jgi:hypothetical protein
MFSINPREDAIRRGVDRLPSYFYREDATLYWDVVHRFVYGVLSLYYKDQKDIDNDEELHNFFKELRDSKCAHVRNVPSKFTVERLFETFTMMIYTCSAYHSMLNTAQFEYGFPLNMPAGLRYVDAETPLDNIKWTDEKKIMEMFPTRGNAAFHAGFSRILAQPPYRTMLEFDGGHFSDPLMKRTVHQFHVELEELSQKIKHRDLEAVAAGLQSYPYVDPANQCISIAN